jgi:hypothetical protein
MFTFVTVAHSVDEEALCFQARSMARYLPEYMVSDILVVDNSEASKTLNHTKVVAHYGPLKTSVSFLSNRDITPAKVGSGWSAQQVLKLQIAERVKTPRYILLDAKNHIVFPLEREFLETKDGKLVSYYGDFSKHPLDHCLRRVLEYLDLSPTHMTKFPPAGTPFTMVTKLVLEMMQYLECREKRPWWETFLDRRLTEFFVYSGYLILTHQLHFNYSFQESVERTIWETNQFPDDVRRAIARTEEKRLPFFSIHRRAIPLLDNQSKAMLAAFWKRRELEGLWH